MRGVLYIVIFICTLSVVSSLDPNWRLVFSDEFDGDSVNTTKWNIRDQPGNYGNGEQQYYTPAQATVSNGYLALTAANVPLNGYPYSSAWVDTQNKFYTTYARYEISAQMAGGTGMWPAFWLLSQEECWPGGAEFDIMEYRGSYPNYANGYYHYGTTCAGAEDSFGNTVSSDTSYATSFHTYALEWSLENATWFVDDTPFLTVYPDQLGFGLPQLDPTCHYMIMNVAMGGGYAGNPDDSSFPASMLIDYVRVYQYGASCTGNTCSGNGCCDPNLVYCICDLGWSGTYCERWTGSFVDEFVSTNVQYTPATDVKVNGWGNGYTFYSDTNVAINYGLTLTLTDNNCPSGCAGMDYSGGGWTSAVYFSYGTFTYIAQASALSGTGFSMGAAGQSSLLEQIAFVISGENPHSVDLITWHSDYEYVQATIALGFDASLEPHNYTFVWSPDDIHFWIDGELVFTATVVIPNGTLAMGIYYTAEPDWYGGTFDYTEPTTVEVSLAAWYITPGNAECSLPTPTQPPTCQPSPVGTGTGLTGVYFDGDAPDLSSFFVNYHYTQVDPTINFNWGGGAPTGLSDDYFSIGWSGQVQPLFTSVYTFYTDSDDGVSLYVNGQLLIDAWQVEAPTVHSGSISLVAGVSYDIVILYFENTGGATLVLYWSSLCGPQEVIPQSQLYPCISSQNAGGNGLTGYYFSDQNTQDLVTSEIDPDVNFNWGNGGPAALNGQTDHFSIAWNGYIMPRYSGTYTFYSDSDDGSKVYVNGTLVVNSWFDKSISEYSGNIDLIQDQKYPITYVYYEDGGQAAAELYWSNACQAKEIIPQSQLFSS